MKKFLLLFSLLAIAVAVSAENYLISTAKTSLLVTANEGERPKYQYYTKAETAKIFKYGWQTEATSLKDSVRDYIQNYLVKGVGLEP